MLPCGAVIPSAKLKRGGGESAERVCIALRQLSLRVKPKSLAPLLVAMGGVFGVFLIFESSALAGTSALGDKRLKPFQTPSLFSHPLFSPPD